MGTENFADAVLELVGEDVAFEIEATSPRGGADTEALDEEEDEADVKVIEESTDADVDSVFEIVEVEKFEGLESILLT